MYSAMVNTNGTTPFLFTDNMRFLTQLTTSSYNGIVQQGDNGIIYGNNQNNTALSIGPFNSGAPSGIRIDASGVLAVSNGITLPTSSTFTQPVSGQLGYTINGTTNTLTTMTTATYYNEASISLPVGVWVVNGYVYIACISTGTLNYLYSGISKNSGNVEGLNYSVQYYNGTINTSGVYGVPHMRVITTTATTIYYLVVNAGFSSGSFRTANCTFNAVRIA